MSARLKKAYHANEEPWLLRSSPNTSISNNANSEASSKTRKADGETGAQLDEALVQRHLYINCGPKRTLVNS
jgi:hypothetical protein